LFVVAHCEIVKDYKLPLRVQGQKLADSVNQDVACKIPFSYGLDSAVDILRFLLAVCGNVKIAVGWEGDFKQGIVNAPMVVCVDFVRRNIQRLCEFSGLFGLWLEFACLVLADGYFSQSAFFGQFPLCHVPRLAQYPYLVPDGHKAVSFPVLTVRTHLVEKSEEV
jgi:hypothetical protein